MIPAVVPILVAVAGFLLVWSLASLSRHGRQNVLLMAIAYAPGAGFGLLSVSWFLATFWRLPHAALLGLTSLVVAAGVGGLLARWKSQGNGGRAMKTEATDLEWSSFWWPVAMLAASSAALITTFVIWLSERPYGVWDAVALWTGRSLLLYRAGTASGDVLYRLPKTAHPDYPLLLPAANSAQYSLGQNEALMVPQVTSLLFLLGLGAMVFLAVRRLRTPWLAALALAWLWSTPSVLNRGVSQCADIPLAYLFLGSAIGMASLFERPGEPRSSRLPPILTGLFLGLLLWVKIEGEVLALLIIGITPVFALSVRAQGSNGLSPRDVAGLVLGLIPGVTADVLFRQYWAPLTEISKFVGPGFLDRLVDPGRWAAVMGTLFEEISPFGRTDRWGLVWIGLALLLLIFGRKRNLTRDSALVYLGMLLAIAGVAWVSVYILTPYNLSWHLRSSFERLLLQLFPAFLVFVFLLVDDRGLGTGNRVRADREAG